MTSRSATAALVPPHQWTANALVVAAGVLALYGPSLWDLLHGIWGSEQQGHGPIILGLSLWLLWRRREDIASGGPAEPRLGAVMVGLSLLLYVAGRTQDILIFEIGSALPLTAGLLITFFGRSSIPKAGFALFFMLFMVPLPGTVVDTLTQPMKAGVSIASEYLLHLANIPVSRSGVLLQVGQYQLLVADACAGLHTLFTLEALGLFYLHLVSHASAVRNTLLAICIVPISFGANVIRVIALCLITYYLGDDAGQGFLHGFAGLVLFVAALTLIIAADGAARAIAVRWARRSSLPASA